MHRRFALCILFTIQLLKEETMQPGEMRKFGRTDLAVTAFGFGTAPLGNIFREIDEAL